MDATRKRFGKDKPPEWFEKKKEIKSNLIWRNYYQWILSPDPGDRASAEEVGQLARSGVRGYGLPIGAGSGSGPYTTTMQVASCTPT